MLHHGSAPPHSTSVTAPWLQTVSGDERLGAIGAALARGEVRHLAGPFGPARLLDPVLSPAEVARRGGMTEIFPPGVDEPVRVEFFGDTMESLRAFDPETQRSRDGRHDIEVFPLSDLFPTRSVTAQLRARLIELFP